MMSWIEAYDMKSRLLGRTMHDGRAMTTIADVTLTSGRFELVGADFTCAVSMKYGSVGVNDGVLWLAGMYGIPDARVELATAPAA